MKEFLLYLFCSISGRPLQYQYTMDKADWQDVQSKFNYFATQLTVDDTIMVAVSDDEIIVQEYYGSGVATRGSAMAINNEVVTTIKKGDSGLDITIDLWRAAESRVFSIVAIFFALASSFALISVLHKWLAGYSDSIPLFVVALALVIDLILVGLWRISRAKYVQVRQGITDIICQ